MTAILEMILKLCIGAVWIVVIMVLAIIASPFFVIDFLCRTRFTRGARKRYNCNS